MGKRLKWDNVAAVREKCVRNDERKLTSTMNDKLKAWQSHYQKLLNVEFPWNASILSDKPPVEYHISPISHFYTSWKNQKTYGFLTFSGGIGM